MSISLRNSKTPVTDRTYWSILKSFFKSDKVSLISPLLVNNKTVSDFTEKAKLFNVFFSSQCTPISNNSGLTSSK